MIDKSLKRFSLIWLFTSPAWLMTVIGFAYIYNYRWRLITLDTGKSWPESGLIETTMAAQEESQVKGISSEIETADARPIIIAEFLQKHESPLQPYDYWGQFLTDLADRHNLDFRLLPAISMQESNLCKKIPEGTFNCLGLGIHKRGTWAFERYEDNFEAAAKILREKYIDKGYVTPDEIQDKYTLGSNGSWEFAVNHFMEVLEYADF